MKIYLFILLACLIAFFQFKPKPLVVLDIQGNQGNQLFQAAAAASLALENKAKLVIPRHKRNIRGIKKILQRFSFRKIPAKKISYSYQQPSHNNFEPISYHPNMRLSGFFESEKFFKKHKEQILRLFAPSKKISRHLKKHYQKIIDHPKTVAIHVRTFYFDYLLSGPDIYKSFSGPDLDYIEKAIALFDKDSLFVVFSDYIPWCKDKFKHISRHFIFIENEKSYHDLYLMSMCKHVIMSNSTFAWWGAYLNKNPNKTVVCRVPWDPKNKRNYNDILLEEWIKIEGNKKEFKPDFK